MTIRSSLSRTVSLCCAAIAVSAASTAAQAVTGFELRDSRGGSATVALINLSTSGGSSDFNIPANGGFPNGPGDNFTMRYRGFVNVPAAGAYTFAVNQDDGVYFNIGTSSTNQSITDNGCCSTSTYTLNLDAGVHPVVGWFQEIGGGESLEISAVAGAAQPFSTATFRLLNDTANGSAFAAATTAAELGNPGKVGTGPTGFFVEIQNAAATPAIPGVGATVDNINESEILSALGGVTEASGTFASINFGNNTDTSPTVAAGVAFPAGTAADDFALRASGFIDVDSPDGQDQVFFHVDGDDGFRLRINGVTVSEFINPTGSSNTLSGAVLVNDGDFLELFFFERGGGENLTFTRDFDGVLGTTFDRVLIGDPFSGIRIQQTNAGLIPEPATAALGLMSMGMLALRRRRNA